VSVLFQKGTEKIALYSRSSKFREFYFEEQTEITAFLVYLLALCRMTIKWKLI